MSENAPWEIPDTVHLSANKKFTGCRARVYWLLRLTKAKGYRHPMDTATQQLAPAGWTPIHTLRRPWAGGAQGDRRLRELRLDYGLEVERRSWGELGGPKDSDTPLYRITEDPIAFGPPTPSRIPDPDPPSRRHNQRILEGCRIWKCEGRPAGAMRSIRVDPGLMNVLSPTIGTVQRAAKLGSVDDAQEVFRQELRERWREDQEDFERQVTGSGSMVIWYGDPESWLFADVVVEVLSSLGAEVAGDWEEVAA